MNVNLLLICALIIFAFIILRIYFLFLLNTEEKEPEELTVDDALSRAQQLYNNGLHLELQRFLKGELPAMAGGLAKERRTGVTKEVPEI